MWVSTPRLFQNPLLRCPQLNTSPSMPKVAARCYYAVRRGRQIGIYQTWAECKEHVHGFPNPAFRKFATREEAENFILSSDQGPSQQGQPYTKCAYSKDSTDSRVQKNHLPHAVILPRTTKTMASTGDALSVSGDHESKKIAEADEIVYTDGASSGNGKKGAKAGWGMYWGDGDRRSAGGPLPGDRQTNQRAELYAIVRALETSIGGKTTLKICTDSQYAINCIDNWSKTWIRNGWKSKSSSKPVENRDLVERALDLRKLRPGKVVFSYVPGHSGVHGNEMADRLAVQGAAQQL